MDIDKIKKKSLKAILKSIAINDDIEVLKYIINNPVINERKLSINDILIFDNYYFSKYASYNNAIKSIKYIFENINKDDIFKAIKSRKYAFFKNITLNNNFELFKYVFETYPEIKEEININYDKDILFFNILNNESYDFLDFFLNKYNDKIINKKECLRLYVNNLFNNNTKEYQDKFIKMLNDKRLYDYLIILDYSRALSRAINRNDINSVNVIMENKNIENNVLNNIYNELKVTLATCRNSEIIKKIIIRNNLHKNGHFNDILNNNLYDTNFFKLCILEDELQNNTNLILKNKKNKI